MSNYFYINLSFNKYCIVYFGLTLNKVNNKTKNNDFIYFVVIQKYYLWDFKILRILLYFIIYKCKISKSIVCYCPIGYLYNEPIN